MGFLFQNMPDIERICQRMMIPAAPNQEIRLSVGILALPFRPLCLNLNLPSTPNTSIRELHGVRARMVGIETTIVIKK